MSHILQSDRQTRLKASVTENSPWQHFAPCPAPPPPPPRGQKQKNNLRHGEGTFGFLWVNNIFTPVLVIPTWTPNALQARGGIQSLGRESKYKVWNKFRSKTWDSFSQGDTVCLK